jgi:hypothetical protein
VTVVTTAKLQAGHLAANADPAPATPMSGASVMKTKSFFLAFANIVMAAVPVFAFVVMGYAEVAHIA